MAEILNWKYRNAGFSNLCRPSEIRFISHQGSCKHSNIRGPNRYNNDPSLGKYLLLFLPATPSSPSRTLEGLFELSQVSQLCPSRALDSPRALLPELQRYKDTIRCASLGAEVRGHQQLTQTLIVRLLKTHFDTILDFEKSTE